MFFIEVQHVEESKEGYFPDAGFTIIVAGKRTAMTEDKVKNADFCLDKEVPETPTDDEGLETRRVLIFRKA
jgi:hypothetical protein